MWFVVLLLSILLGSIGLRILFGIYTNVSAFVVAYQLNRRLIETELYLFHQCQDQQFLIHVPNMHEKCADIVARKNMGAFYYTFYQHTQQERTRILELASWWPDTYWLYMAIIVLLLAYVLYLAHLVSHKSKVFLPYLNHHWTPT